MTDLAEYKKGDKIKCKISTWELGRTPNTGTKYVRIRCTNRVEWTGWLTDKTEENTMGTLADLGFLGSDIRMLVNDDALDREIDVIATVDSFRIYEGKRYYSARWLNKKFEGGFNKKSLDGIDLDDFAMDTTGYIDGAKDINQPAVSDYQISEDATFAADDIPF
jgi:hypothetical protein